MNLTCLTAKAKERIVLGAAGVAALTVVLSIAIPDNHGARVAHVGLIDFPLDSECLLASVSELDAGSEIVPWREGARIVDARINYSGSPSELYVTQRERAGHWELIAEVRRTNDGATADHDERQVETITRNAALHVLARCASRAGWDGGVACERREKGRACIPQ